MWAVGRWNGTGGAGGSHSAAVRTRMPVFRERLDPHGFTVLQRHRGQGHRNYYGIFSDMKAWIYGF